MFKTLATVGGIVVLVCFILLMMELYSRKQTTLMIVCIVLLFVFGVGMIVAFVYGWMQAARWRIQNIMYVWSGGLIVFLICGYSLRDLLHFSF